MGWLNSYAEGQEKSWGERIADNGNPIPIVPAEAGQYLLRHMIEMQPVTNNGFGLQARSDGEITDYFVGVGIPLENWEFVLMRKMCHGYLQGVRTGNDRFGIQPMNRDEGV
jgi:hypothetical protein